MTALSADRNTQSRISDLTEYPCAVDVIYKGAMVSLNSSGYLAPASDTAGNSRVVGVADEQVDNSGGSAGDKNCRVRSGRYFRFAATSIAQSDLGRTMYVVDDQTFDADPQDAAIVAGVLYKRESSTEGWIYVPPPAAAAEAMASEISMQVRNESGATIEAGDIVHVSHYDETEDRFVITLADADAQGTAFDELWTLREDLATATNGVAHKTFRETGQNTSGATEGDPIFLSATPGDWTLTDPTDGDPNGVARRVGWVAVVNATTGEVEINLMGSGLIQVGTNEVQNAGITADKLDLSSIATLTHVAHDDSSPVTLLASDANKARTVAIIVSVTEDMAGGPDFDIGETDDTDKFLVDFGAGVSEQGESFVAVGSLTAAKALLCTIADAGSGGEFDVIVLVGA